MVVIVDNGISFCVLMKQRFRRFSMQKEILAHKFFHNTLLKTAPGLSTGPTQDSG